MAENVVGIRDLKAGLSGYLRKVKRGSSVLVTERGQPVARLVPVKASVEERIQQMVDAGLASWSGKRLGPAPTHRPRVKGPKTVADLLLEDRE